MWIRHHPHSLHVLRRLPPALRPFHAVRKCRIFFLPIHLRYHSRSAKQRVIRRRLTRSRPHALKGFRISVSAVFHRLWSYREVLPLVRTQPFEKWAQRWHAGGDEGKVVLDAARRMVSGSASARQGERVLTIKSQRGTGRRWHRSSHVIALQKLPGLHMLLRH